MKQKKKEGKYCSISLNSGEHIRHCFVNGEYCSHQSNILTERERLHQEGTINAFVIMNFSDMSDVVYRWRLNSFIESLKNYLYLDLDAQKLFCYSSKNDRDSRLKKIWATNQNGNVKEVSSVKVVRSDTESANNYVICSRICQQMLIADLVIVDVSWQNPNVFYEFGIAVALGKLILPICYSESFYKRSLPDELKAKANAEEDKPVEHHIGCFPWRKQLFEYYGIRYKRDGAKTKYISFDEVTKREYGFSDIQYNRFPYDVKIPTAGRWKSLKIGQRIYEKLMRQYNVKGADCNTAIIYTMEGILNEEQAGLCIINYYQDIVDRMKNEKCFCGERVGVLVQGNQIPEKDKDVSENYNLLYSIAEITRTGVNQATYQVSKEKIKAEDTFSLKVLKELETEIRGYETNKGNEDFVDVHKEDIERFIKNYVGNRGLLVYPDNPVYVERMKNGIDSNFLEDVKGYSEKNKKAFCLYHVMLKTLQYTNQIVVDITNNSLQSLFWLGAAHGAEIHAVTVIHEASGYEQSVEEYKQSRNVFDVSGLWAAIHYTHDTEGFYRQLNLVQKGIEQNSKLVLRNVESFETYLERYEKSKNKNAESAGKESAEITHVEDKVEDKIEEAQEQFKKWLNYKEKKQRELLELYYRNWFWKPMLRYNRLRIYLPQRDVSKGKNTFSGIEKWNMDAVSSLTHYLSKRSVIGEYRVIQLPGKKQDCEAGNVNYIALDTPVKPMGKSLPEYIWEKQSERKNGQRKVAGLHECKEERECVSAETCKGETGEQCLLGTRQRTFVKLGEKDPDNSFQCLGREGAKWTEAAQLILWKEEVGEKEEYLFRVGITGTSEVATYALSSLFVDERNKLFDVLKPEEQGDDKNKDDSKKEFLCNLQLKIREKLIDRYLQCLNDRILKICKKNQSKWEKGQKECYCALVKYAVTMYLSTVLYRYFFPFLSKKDIQRICNGLYMFIQSMKSERISPFALDYSANRNSNFKTSVDKDVVEKIIEEIPLILKNILEQFEGIEVFYEVDIQLEAKEESGNIISLCRNEDYSISIQEMETGDSMQLMVNFIGLDSKK